MKNLIIIGARGFGREVYNLAVKCDGYKNDYEIKGYLDDKSDALDAFPGYPAILDSVEHYNIQPNDIFICALGDPKYKKKYAEIILNKGGFFTSLIHPNVLIGKNTQIGIGCIIGRNAGISCDIKIDDFVTILPHGGIGHDCRIGKWSILERNASLSGGVTIGCETVVHTGAIILPRKKIGDNVIVGAGSVVMRNVSSGVTVYGNPAKVLKY